VIWLSRLQQYWHDNGTRIIGQFWILLGTIAAIDHEQWHELIRAMGPVWGPRFAYCLSLIGGIVTWRRSITNAARIAREG
jgi:hypothetical protein